MNDSLDNLKEMYGLYDHHYGCYVHDRFEGIVEYSDHPGDISVAVAAFCDCRSIRKAESVPTLAVGTQRGSRIWTGEFWTDIPFADEDSFPATGGLIPAPTSPPESPVAGDIYTDLRGRIWVYTVDGSWVAVSESGGELYRLDGAPPGFTGAKVVISGVTSEKV